MNFKICILLLGMVLLGKTLAAITMTKDEILKLDLAKYNKEGCPEFAKKGGLYMEYNCTYTFYCRDNKCQPDNYDSPFFEYEDNGKTQKLIKDLCLKESVSNGDCTTEVCKSDADCLSNSCFNSTCISGKKSLFTECSDVNDDTDYENAFQKIKCGMIEGERCSSDKSCAGRCYSASPYPNTCHSHVNIMPTAPIHIDYILYFIGGIAIIAIGICLCCCIITKRCRKNKN